MSLYAIWLAVQADVALAVVITACAVLALLITYAGASSTATDDALRATETAESEDAA